MSPILSPYLSDGGVSFDRHSGCTGTVSGVVEPSEGRVIAWHLLLD